MFKNCSSPHFGSYLPLYLYNDKSDKIFAGGNKEDGSSAKAKIHRHSVTNLSIYFYWVNIVKGIS